MNQDNTPKRKAGRPKKDPNAPLIPQKLIDKAEKAKVEKYIDLAKKTKEEAVILEIKRKTMEKEIINISTVESIFVEIASICKSELYRLIQEVPPKAEGLSAHEIEKMLDYSVNDILQNLNNNFRSRLETIVVDE